MELLRELELARRGGVAFELFSDTHRDHHHLWVCIGCGRTEEFESAPGLTAGGAGRQPQGIRLIECVLNVRALCRNCQAEASRAHPALVGRSRGLSAPEHRTLGVRSDPAACGGALKADGLVAPQKVFGGGGAAAPPGG